VSCDQGKLDFEISIQKILSNNHIIIKTEATREKYNKKNLERFTHWMNRVEEPLPQFIWKYL
jgi:hypothetical protein